MSYYIWNKATSFHRNLITSRASLNKKYTRKSKVFHVLLIGSIYLVSVATIISIINYSLITIVFDRIFTGVPPIMPISILIGIISLLYLSKKGYQSLTSYIFIALLWLPAAYTSFRWGALMYQSIAIYALVIILSGILINSYASLSTTIFTGIFLITLTVLQHNQLISVDLSWRQHSEDIYNAIMVFATLGAISLVSWLYNRELRHAIKHTLKSKIALKKERDSLEEQVMIRTQQLETAQAEKMMQWQQFVEIGRSTAEIFHDIKNPLTSVSLNLEQLYKLHQGKNTFSNKKIQDALRSINYIGQFITATNHQIKPQQVRKWFSHNKQIGQAIKFLSPKATANKVKFNNICSTNIKICGCSSKFYQVIINLISNSIDSYHDHMLNSPRIILIKTEQDGNYLRIFVKDSGCGITLANQSRIFNPLFTTKTIDQGTGLGLSIVKSVIVNDFGGSIFFCSQPNKGSTFAVTIPIKK
ncbi:MAG: HAMP domain-containing histidine kinase [Candidatus Pacebacteria bacterium]|jgi:signal transduction histidine kinase|nr:HAMP domain-containing histidine kinase [Candidatus Paceibacterota bacterium]MBT3512045.1 HAMP domain-containing histidine kinase [Candidatus Paceibacterota bacterium]MBT4004475.1 HAMP domain-containing histidine kinase [Candidatus Paceibacterota bacterium]MBT4359076.1 HAMP domain-containing histidine kinase [Candidatus Paceibacterota bacterium]MBT4681371.1 HAMP domain-containing histidine kinase [Candidatus Paceibacterota bacterium]